MCPEVLAEMGRIVALAAALLAVMSAALSAQDGSLPSDYDPTAEAELQGTYGYVRALDGSATLIQQGGERIELDVNEPVLVGDRIFVSGSSRLEVALADRNIVRLGDRADLGFRALAESADATDAGTVLDVRRGTIQLVVPADRLGLEMPSILLPNATVQIRAAGSYLIVVDDDARAEVVVREGRADVLTADDGAEVRAGESLFVEGTRSASLQFAAAPGLDRLEQWGQGLEGYALGQSAEYVDNDLDYAAASLDSHGTWVSIGATWAWRPYVSVGWAPYRYGRWRYTPSGLFWVSSEPWGWAPYHYGYWDYDPGWGWVWFPGRRFSIAHVYWYWGSGYAGWIPSGYYWRYYGRRYGTGFGFRYGVYGWVDGTGWYDHNRYWTFLPTNRIGQRRQQAYLRTGNDLGRSGVRIGRGVLTNDTRELRPDVWRRPADGITRLTRAGAASSGGRLADATPFVSRVDRLPGDVERIAIRGRDGVGRAADASAAGASAAGGGLRSRAGVDDARRPTVERSPATRAGLGAADRTGSAGTTGTTRSGSASAPRVTGRETGSLRRPDSGSADRAVRTNPIPTRPTTGRGTAGGGATAESAARSPGTREMPGARPTLRRPDAAAARSGPAVGRELRRPTEPVSRGPTTRSGTTSPPTIRSSGATSRPTVRSSGATSRPTVGSSSEGTSRPTVRSSGATARPPTRSSGTSSRPTVRSSGATSRPTIGSSSGGTSRPTVRSSGATARPPTRSSGTTSRPTVRSSGTTSPPTVRSSGPARSAGPSRSSGATRSSGTSRSSGASRSTGASRSSGVSRSRRSGGGAER